MGRAMARALRAMARLAPPASLAPSPLAPAGRHPGTATPRRAFHLRLPFPLAPTAPSSTAPSTPLGRLAASPPRRARYRASARLDARDGGGGDAVDKLGAGRHQLRVNEAIDARQVRLVNDGPSAPSSAPAHEVLSTIVALRRAKLAGLDLVEVNPRAVPPVCRVMNFDELRYELRQKERDARKKAVERRRHDKIKVLRLRPHISAHDLRVKAAQAARFFADGHRVTLRVEFSDADGVKAKLRPRAGAVLFEEFRAALTDATAETNEREGRDPIAFATEVEGKMIGPRHMITTFAPARVKKGKTPSAKKKKEGRQVEGAQDRDEGASLADDHAKEEEIQTTEPSASFHDLASLESAIAAQAERTRERKARAKEAAARAEALAEGGGGGGDGASAEAAEAEAEAKAAVAELLALKARRAELESEPSAKDPSESESAAAEEEEERGEGASPRILPSSLPSRRRAASPRAARGYRSASLAAFPHLSSDRSPGGVFVSKHRLITGGHRWFSATTLADKVALAKARVAEEKERKRLAASERAAKDAARRKRREGFKKIRARGNEARPPRRDPGGDERETRRGDEEGAFRSVPKASSSGAAAASEASDSASEASDSASAASASASASASPPAPASAFRMGEAFEAHVAARRAAFGHASGGHWSTSGGGGGALPPPGSTSPGSERSAAATGALALATAAAVTLGLAAAILERSDGGTTGEGEGGGAGEGEGRSGTAGGGWGASRAGDEGNRRGAGSGAASAVGKGAGAYAAGFGVASAVAVAADAWKG